MEALSRLAAVSVNFIAHGLSIVTSSTHTHTHTHTHTQPNYPVVLPIWITECNEPFMPQLIEQLNVSDEASTSASHPVSLFIPINYHSIIYYIIFVYPSLPAASQSALFSLSYV